MVEHPSTSSKWTEWAFELAFLKAGLALSWNMAFPEKQRAIANSVNLSTMLYVNIQVVLERRFSQSLCARNEKPRCVRWPNQIVQFFILEANEMTG
jgi:hypothetical protein